MRDPAEEFEQFRLGRILAELTPQEPEVHGLAALMEIQASRTRARTPSKTDWPRIVILYTELANKVSRREACPSG
jgi:predicted RNA polymerase sigma factor